MPRRLLTAFKLVRDMGVRWCLFRVVYRLQGACGWFEYRTPPFEWSSRPLAAWLRPGVPAEPERYQEWRSQSGGAFFFSTLPLADDLARVADRDSTVGEARAVLAGHWRYFSRSPMAVGFPPDWHLNPASGKRFPSDQHWSRLSDFGFGDIKYVWEASRFSVTFLLARAYCSTRDESFAAAFWALVESWADANPPQRGVNWKCGQEASFRVMAWCFGLHAFSGSAETTPARVTRLVAMIAAHGERIERNLGYAWSQKNNHGISEAVGLWTIGVLFPELARSATWKRTGRRLIDQEVARQVYADGSYVQHSFNYHRVMLDDLVWALRLGEVNREPLPRLVYDAVGRAAGFLEECLDRETGQAPQTGANDGALVVPLSGCDLNDHRPAVQSASLVARGGRAFSPGPWDEQALWLFGPAGLSGRQLQPPARPLAAPQGGYYVVRGSDAWALIRCADYRDRPGHMDQLHVDLWWKGLNIVPDAGTFRYNADAPWNNALTVTAVHNTMMVDDHDQMTQVSRFLALDWTRGHVVAAGEQDGWRFWIGEHDGYTRLGVTHRRAVLHDGATWWVCDELRGRDDHRYRLHWLLSDQPHQWSADAGGARLQMQTPRGAFDVRMWCDRPSTYSLVRGGPDVRGWRSRYYGEREEALSIVAEGHGVLPVLTCTRLSDPAGSASAPMPAALGARLSEWHRRAIVGERPS